MGLGSVHGPLAFGGSPALAHEVEEVEEGVLVSSALLLGELAGAAVEVAGEVGGFGGGAAQVVQGFGEGGEVLVFFGEVQGERQAGPSSAAEMRSG